MEENIKERFPWMASMHGKFVETLLSDSEIGTLEQLQWNIAAEVEKLEQNFNFKTAKLLLKGVEFFYLHFCRICSFENEQDFPGLFTFSTELKTAWSYVLSSIFRICLLLSQGKRVSKWIQYAWKEISRFPGEQNVLLDALLLVQRLNKRFKDAYGAILQNFLEDMTRFVPVVFDDPVEFLKMHLLVRRLKLLMKHTVERVRLHSRASKCLAPPSLWDWLCDHGFTVPWTRKGFKKVNLGTDLCSKIGGGHKFQLKIAKELRKVLLPGLCNKRKTDQQRPCTNQILSEVTVNEGKVKRRKVKKLRNNAQEDGEEGMSVNRSEIQEPTEMLEENVSFMINHTSAISTVDDKLVREKKSKKKRKSVHSEQNLHYETGQADLPFEEDNEEIRKNKIKFKSNMVKRWKNNIQEGGEEGMSVSRCELLEPTEISEEIVDSNENVLEKKSKKRGKSVHVEENLPLETAYTGLPLQDYDSETARLEAKRNRKQKLNTIAKKILNQADRSIYKDSCVVKDNMDDQVEVMGRRKWTEMDHDDKEYCVGNDGYEGEPKSKRKRQKEKIVTEEIPDNENEASSELEDISQNAKITKSKRRRNAKELGNNSKETEFVADKNESGADDSPGIVEEIYLNNQVPNVRVTLKKEDYDFNKDTKTELESNSEVENEIAENIFILDSKPSPCISESGSLLDNQTSLSMNDFDNKLQSVDNVVSSTTEEHSGHTAQTEEETSQESVVQTECLDNSPYQISDLMENCIKSDPISEELVDGKKKISIQTDFEMKTIEKNNISLETVPVLESHGSPMSGNSLNDNSAEEVEKQKSKKHPSINTDELICVRNELSFSETNHIDTEESKNNAKGIVDSELSFERSALFCDTKKEKPTQETKVPESPLGNNCLKTGNISSENLIATVSSESVDISSPERTNLKKINNSCNIKIKSEPVLETLELEGSPVSDHSSLNGNDSAQKVEKQKDGHASVKTDEQVKVKNEVHVSETNHIQTETENVIAESELSFQETVLSCNVKKERITQENQVSESSIDSCNIKIKSESPLETLELHESPVSDHSSLNGNDSAQKVEKQKDGHASVNTDEQIAVKNEVHVSETNHIQTETENNVIAESELSFQETVLSCNVKKEKITQENQVLESSSSETVDSSSPERTNIEKMNNSCSNTVKSELQLESLSSSSDSLPDKTILEADSDNDSSIKVDIPEVKKEKDDTSTNSDRPPQNNSIDDQPKNQVAGLFFDAKSPNSKTEEGLHKDSDRSPNQQMLAKSSQVETPNTSAARVTIENVLTLAEFAGRQKKSMKQIFNKGDLTSTLNSMSEKHLLKFTSSAANEKPVASVSFLDIAAENIGSLNESHNFSRNSSETSGYLQYRDISSDEDNRSEDTPSEGKSALRSDGSESASEVNNDSGDEGNSLKDYDSPVSSCQEDDDEQDIRSSQAYERVVSIPTKSMNIKNLNPVVNLGVRCDSKNFIASISNVSADSIIVPTNSSVLPDIKTEIEEINETRTFNPNEASSTVNLLVSPVNESARKLDSIQQSDIRKHDEVSTVDIDVKMKIQPKHEDVNEPCLIADQESTVSGEDHKSTELTEARKESGLTLGMELRRPATAVQTENPVPDVENLGVLNEDTPLTHRMTLRSRHSSSASSEGNSVHADRDSTVLNRDILEISCRTTRSRNPSSPKSQETLAPANEGSNVLNLDAPVTEYMNLRGRNSTVSSSQEKSTTADEASSMALQNTPATRRRNKNPSTPPNQGAKKRRSPTVTTRSSKRLKKEVNLNLGFDFSELSLNSPRTLRTKPKESSTSDQGNPCRKSTRSSVISSTDDAKLKEKDLDPEGYNLRSRKSVIMPGKLKL